MDFLLRTRQFFTSFHEFLKKIKAKVLVFVDFLNPYKKINKESFAVSKVRVAYNRAVQWLVQVVSTSIFVWIGLFLMDYPLSFLQCVGAVVLWWLAGQLLKEVRDAYVEGKIKWVRELPTMQPGRWKP